MHNALYYHPITISIPFTYSFSLSLDGMCKVSSCFGKIFEATLELEEKEFLLLQVWPSNTVYF